ncbi:hypothetical protein ACMATS_21435 [Streptoverticillium reticulum]|uniref:hypothetical protein n=1 Tax=Streptoverticillium reticulum TaxID=1433415 RepID=UPI0039BEE328
MLRHVIAPARFFSQVPNEIIRHPRLSSDAVRLLLWQLSLPEGANEPLYESAKRAGIKKTAFLRAKRELASEGYLHDWRRQDRAGRWSRSQLVSNVPLTAEQAVAVRDTGQPTPPPTPAPAPTPAPTAPEPAVGVPSARPVGRSQTSNTKENTPHPDHRRGAQLLAAAVHGDPRLRLGSRDVRQLAPLASEWLARGATPQELREALTSGLPEPVHSPAAITRDRLLRKMPDPLPERTRRIPVPAPVPPPVSPAPYDTSAAVAATERGAAAAREALRQSRLLLHG